VFRASHPIPGNHGSTQILPIKKRRKGGHEISMGRIDKEEIGYRQQMIMQCFWDAGAPLTIQDIVDRLEVKCGRRFSKPSINTLVLMLVDRGFLIQDGRIRQAYTFRALVSEEEFQLRELRRFKSFTFHDSVCDILDKLITLGVSEEDLQSMKGKLEQTSCQP
jgi:predicted transcriptional regulator